VAVARCKHESCREIASDLDGWILDFELRPTPVAGFEHRFETAAGEQAEVDFAQFRTAFTLDPDQIVTLWLFTLVLGYSR
jgi:hypothetical protein